MAIESRHFKREDIYTLFVTTRIINFLKAIPFEEDQLTLGDTLDRARRQGKRSALGAELLERLLTEQCLYAATGSGLKPLLRFKPELFFQVWSKLDQIGTQERNTIRLK